MAFQIFKKRSARFAQQNKLVRARKLVKNSLTGFWMKVSSETVFSYKLRASKNCFALIKTHSKDGVE